MEPTRRRLLLAIGASGALAGCLGDSDDDQEGATVQLYDHRQFGDILVGPERLTLYMFDEDEQGSLESVCYEDCAENWPPLIVEEAPTAGTGVGAELTTFERDDGETQVAANGWPLYYWVGDGSVGNTEGQGIEDVWWVLGPDGVAIREELDDSPTGGPGY